MSSISLNNIIGMDRMNTLWCNGSTLLSGSKVLGSNPSRVVSDCLLKKKDMEKDNDNMEPDPFKSQDLTAGPRGDMVDDFKSYIDGYFKVPTEREKSICG